MKRFIFTVVLICLGMSMTACSKKKSDEPNNLTGDTTQTHQADYIPPQVFETPSNMIDWSNMFGEEDDNYIDTGLSEWMGTFEDSSGTLEASFNQTAPPVDSYGYTDYAGLEEWFTDFTAGMGAVLRAGYFAAAHFPEGTRLMTATTDKLHLTYAIFDEGVTGDIWYSNNFYLTLANPNVQEKRQDNAAFIYRDDVLRHFIIFSDTGNVFWAMSQDGTDSSAIAGVVEAMNKQMP